jgi:hypothetical protein
MVDYILQRSDIVVDEFMRNLPRGKLLNILRSNLERMRPLLPIDTGRLQRSLNVTIFNDRIMVYIPARIFYAQYLNEKPRTMGYFDKAYDAAFKPGFLADITTLKLIESSKKPALLAAIAAEALKKR